MEPLPLALDGSDIEAGRRNSCEGAVEVGGIGVQIGKGLNNSCGGAVDFSQSRTSDGAVAIGGLDGSDVSSRRNTCEPVLLKLVGSESRSVRPEQQQRRCR